jgi:hypothetical protein
MKITLFRPGSSRNAYSALTVWEAFMRLILLSFLLAPLSATAGELPADDLVRTMMQHERAPAPTDSFLHNPISLGSVSIDIGSTRLGDVSDSLRVSVVDAGKGNVVWSCAAAGDEAFWLISEATDIDGEPLVTAIVRTAAPMDAPQCASVDWDIDEGFPGLGASLAQIEAALGSTEEMGSEIVAYRTQDRLGDDGGYPDVITTLSYHMADGVADAVACDVVIVR